MKYENGKAGQISELSINAAAQLRIFWAVLLLVGFVGGTLECVIRFTGGM